MAKNKEVGLVTECLPDSRFRVEIGGKNLMAYCSGKMRIHQIRVLPGDKVEVELDPYGGTATNRIVRRL
jgi:translation initiation factor IF-1